MKQRHYVFIPNMNGGWITRRFDSEEEAKDYAGQFFESYIKKM